MSAEREKLVSETVAEETVDEKVVTAERIPIVEEELVVGKVRRETGRVRISSTTEEITQPVSAELERREVDIQEIDIGEVVREAPGVRSENGVTIIPVLEERLVVRKELVLVKELHIREVTRTEVFEDEVILRKTSVEVTRDGDEEVLPM